MNQMKRPLIKGDVSELIVMRLPPRRTQRGCAATEEDSELNDLTGRVGERAMLKQHDSPTPRRTGHEDFPHPALSKTLI